MRHRKLKRMEQERPSPEDIDEPSPVQRILIVGAGRLLHDIISLINESSLFVIEGILDPDPLLKNQSVNDIRVIGWLDAVPEGRISAVIGTPSKPGGFDRTSVFQILLKRGVNMPILKSSKCRCSAAAVIHKGAVLLEGCSVSGEVVIGPNSLICAGAHIGKHVNLPGHSLVTEGESILHDRNQTPKTAARNLEAACAASNETIQDIIRKLNSSSNDIVLIVDSAGTLKGTVTDGDIRRGILAGVNIQAPISSIMNYTPTSAPLGTPLKQMLSLMQSGGIRHLPVVDAKNRPVRLETIKALAGETLPNDAVVMAGGLGTRLRPLTDSTPKPLLNVAGRPILDHILENIRRSGITDVAISLNYRGRDIREHVESGDKHDLNINFLSESKRMGTAGALSLITPKPTRPFLVMNGDLITRLNFSRLFEFQKRTGDQLVMCVCGHRITIPYGVVEISKSNVTGLREKPEQEFFINAGIYVVSPACLALIPPNTFFDMPDLVNRLVEEGSSVGAFPIIEYWRDIGTPADLQAASEEPISDDTRSNARRSRKQPILKTA
jgi:NDP-sugar pyrophosphorylase family protein